MVRLCVSILRQPGTPDKRTSAQAKENYVIMGNQPCRTESRQGSQTAGSLFLA